MIRKVILFLALLCCATAAIDNCKKGGEYCLNHWDCCSNTCLSYLYKCSKIPKQTPPDSLMLSAPAAAAAFAPASAPAAPGITDAPATGSGAMSLDSLIEIVFRPLILVPNSGREINAIEARLGIDELQEYDTTTINPTTVNPTTIPSTNGPQCLEIGSKCYRNDECCTERCHGFLHQCVT